MSQGSSRSQRNWVGALLGVMVMGCGMAMPGDALESTVSNGLVSGTYDPHGLGTNGLGTHGLNLEGFGSPEFSTWFQQDPTLANEVMTYVVRCSVPTGQSRVHVDPKTGKVYTWWGRLGLAPGWARGAPATELEQQVISACLAAHTNKFGVEVVISIQGLGATGQPIPLEPGELDDFPVKEACFFGNLFNGEGLFAGNDSYFANTESSVRACGLEAANASPVDQCPPIRHVGRCSTLCEVSVLSNGFYESCTYNGKRYRPMTTRIRREDVYKCGDGVCQVSESCGTGTTPLDCKDCGACAPP